MISITKNLKDREVSTISLKDIQKQLGVSYSTIYRWVKHRDFPHYKIRNSRKVVFNQKKVLEWLEQNSQQQIHNDN